MQLLIANGCAPTGRLIQGMLRERGVREDNNCVLCWGRAYGGPLPSLNAHGHFNKLEQLQRLAHAGVATLHVFTAVPTDPAAYPLVARRLNHVGGRDIILCRNPERARLALAKGRNYFTHVEPRRTEYRVWVYRRRHLGTYEKWLAHPERRFRRTRRGTRIERFGCNYKNGWAFRLVTEGAIPRDCVDLAQRAIEALGLDFGAVDILVRPNGRAVVLEVNTAPGVEGEGRQAIQGLVEHVATWQRKGFPKRRGEEK